MSAATTEIQPTITITPEQIAFFHENGFLAIDQITTLEEVERIKVVYDRLFAEKAGRDEGAEFDLAGTDEDDKVAKLPQILGPSRFAPELENTLYRANALSISRQLLGPECTYGGDHAIFKPANYGAATPWHQDEAYWNPALEYNSLSVWMPLQEATVENGCMQFIPGSHKSEVVEHQSINNDPRIHGLETVQPIDESRAVVCPLPAGGATLHLNRTMHFTGANGSVVARRAYILGFGTPAKPYKGERRFPWNERKIAPRQEREAKAAAKE